MIGIAITSARAGGPQWRPSSSRSTTSPSEISVRISASSIELDDARVADVDRDHVELGEHDPERHREHRDRRAPSRASRPRARRRPRAARRRSAAPRRSRCPSAAIPSRASRRRRHHARRRAQPSPVRAAAARRQRSPSPPARRRSRRGGQPSWRRAAARERRALDRRLDPHPGRPVDLDLARRASRAPGRGSRGCPAARSNAVASAVSVTGRVESYCKRDRPTNRPAGRARCSPASRRRSSRAPPRRSAPQRLGGEDRGPRPRPLALEHPSTRPGVGPLSAGNRSPTGPTRLQST